MHTALAVILAHVRNNLYRLVCRIAVDAQRARATTDLREVANAAVTALAQTDIGRCVYNLGSGSETIADIALVEVLETIEGSVLGLGESGTLGECHVGIDQRAAVQCATTATFGCTTYVSLVEGSNGDGELNDRLGQVGCGLEGGISVVVQTHVKGTTANFATITRAENVAALGKVRLVCNDGRRVDSKITVTLISIFQTRVLVATLGAVSLTVLYSAFKVLNPLLT